MVAFTKDTCVRKTRIYGTLGEIECVGGQFIELTPHGKASEQIAFAKAPVETALTGHDGADYFLAKAFFSAVFSGDKSLILTGPQDTLVRCFRTFFRQSHSYQFYLFDLILFAVYLEQNI